MTNIQKKGLLHSHNSGRSGSIQSIAKHSATAFSLLALLLPACTSTDTEVTSSEDGVDNVTATEVSNDTLDYTGQTVSIRGDVQEVLGDATFLMDDEQIFSGEEILIVNASGSPLLLPEGEGTDVQVTGEVHNFVIADVEKAYGIDFDPQLYTEYENQPAIIARSVALSPDSGDITESPETYYNKRIAVEGTVEEKMEPGIFKLDDEQLLGGEDLLVIATPDMRVDQEEDVTVVGVLRPFVKAEFERDYDLTWDLDFKQKIEAEYENKPVFVEEEVYPSAQ